VEADFTSAEWIARERKLVAAARAGDTVAIAQLYRAFAPRLYRTVLMPRLGNQEAAEDALSETFRTALERLQQFQDKGVSLYFWLSRIAVNKATDMHRVKARTRRALTSFESLLAPLRPSAPRPEKELAARERVRMLEEYVSTVLTELNPRYARAIQLRFLEDRSRQECADLLEVKLGTFDVVLLRALRSFRKKWEALVGATEARSPA